MKGRCPSSSTAATWEDCQKVGQPEHGASFARCPSCGRYITLTKAGMFRNHVMMPAPTVATHYADGAAR